MRKHLLLIGLVLLIALVNGLLFIRHKEQSPKLEKHQVSPTPRVVAEETVHQFGDRDPGDVVSHVFTLRNEGTGPLQFKGVRPVDQGSVSSHVIPHVIPPGAVAQLHTKVHIRPQQMGTVRREIIVETNDPNHSTMTFALEGRAVSRVLLTPERLELKGVTAGQPCEAALELRTTNGLALQVVGTRTSGKEVAVNIKEVSPGNRYDLRVTVQPILKQGPFRGYVHLQTDHKLGYKIIAIPVVIYVGGPKDNSSKVGCFKRGLFEVPRKPPA